MQDAGRVAGRDGHCVAGAYSVAGMYEFANVDVNVDRNGNGLANTGNQTAGGDCRRVDTIWVGEGDGYDVSGMADEVVVELMRLAHNGTVEGFLNMWKAAGE